VGGVGAGLATDASGGGHEVVAARGAEGAGAVERHGAAGLRAFDDHELTAERGARFVDLGGEARLHERRRYS